MITVSFQLPLLLRLVLVLCECSEISVTAPGVHDMCHLGISLGIYELGSAQTCQPECNETERPPIEKDTRGRQRLLWHLRLEGGQPQ